MTSEFDPLAQTVDNGDNESNGFEKVEASGDFSAAAAMEDFSTEAMSASDDKPQVSSTTTPLIDLGGGGDEAPAKVEVSDTDKEPSKGATDWIKNIDPRDSTVMDLIMWTDPKKSGLVFAGLLGLLIALTLFSVLTVIAYVSMAMWAGCFTFVLYKRVMGAVQKSNEGHPFQSYLEQEFDFSKDKVHECLDKVLSKITCLGNRLKRLFLAEDIVESVKFFLVLWMLSYIGAWFNGMTLLILGLIGVFSIPKFYKTYQTQIDQNIEMIRGKCNEVFGQIRAKIPIGQKDKKE